MSDLSGKKVEFPEFYQQTYGLSYAEEIATLKYGYAMLTIAGADGEVSQAEMNWLINHQRSINVPEEIIEAYKVFDYKNANLEELIPDINRCDVPFNVPRVLIFDAIQMCKADLEFATQEQMAVKKAAKLLGVPDDIVLALNRLVEHEESLNAMRRALLETDR